MQAGNGAIVITTKKGKKGTGRLTYSNNTRFETLYRFPDIQKTYQRGGDGITNTDYRRQFGAAYEPEHNFMIMLEISLKQAFQKHTIFLLKQVQKQLTTDYQFLI
jgi:hypothetical protein